MSTPLHDHWQDSLNCCVLPSEGTVPPGNPPVPLDVEMCSSPQLSKYHGALLGSDLSPSLQSLDTSGKNLLPFSSDVPSQPTHWQTCGVTHQLRILATESIMVEFR